MRVVFMGTPEFALPSLEALIEMPLEVVGAFTQPDRPSGRGHRLESPPVKKLAQSKGIPVFQFERIRRQEGLDALRSLKPDLCVTAAFGQILSQKILDVPRFGTINVHASLLPRHRGAAPINWSIIMGDRVTGVTTMLTNAGLDTGDILLKKEVEILQNETAGELTQRLAKEGGRLLKTTIERYISDEITPVKQDEALMSYEPMLTKELGRINWNDDPETICRLVRGVNPWPGAYTTLNGETLKIWSAIPLYKSAGEENGCVVAASPRDGLVVAAGGAYIEITELQMPGGKRMQAKAYLSGRQIALGAKLGE